MGNKTIDQHRAEFESWLESIADDPETLEDWLVQFGGHYKKDVIGSAWQAWQSARGGGKMKTTNDNNVIMTLKIDASEALDVLRAELDKLEARYTKPIDKHRAEFEQWYSTYDVRTPPHVFEMEAAWAAWKAARGLI